MADARTARLCVLLGTVKGTPFVTIMPAPTVPGGSSPVQVGPLTEDSVTLAGRIAARLPEGWFL